MTALKSSDSKTRLRIRRALMARATAFTNAADALDLEGDYQAAYKMLGYAGNCRNYALSRDRVYWDALVSIGVEYWESVPLGIFERLQAKYSTGDLREEYATV